MAKKNIKKQKSPSVILLDKLQKQLEAINLQIIKDGKLFIQKNKDKFFVWKCHVNKNLLQEYSKLIICVYSLWAYDKIKKDNEFIRATCHHFWLLHDIDQNQHELFKELEISAVKFLKQEPDGQLKNDFVAAWNKETEIIPKMLKKSSLSDELSKLVKQYWEIDKK